MGNFFKHYRKFYNRASRIYRKKGLDFDKVMKDAIKSAIARYQYQGLEGGVEQIIKRKIRIIGKPNKLRGRFYIRGEGIRGTYRIAFVELDIDIGRDHCMCIVGEDLDGFLDLDEFLDVLSNQEVHYIIDWDGRKKPLDLMDVYIDLSYEIDK